MPNTHSCSFTYILSKDIHSHWNVLSAPDLRQIQVFNTDLYPLSSPAWRAGFTFDNGHIFYHLNTGVWIENGIGARTVSHKDSLLTIFHTFYKICMEVDVKINNVLIAQRQKNIPWRATALILWNAHAQCLGQPIRSNKNVDVERSFIFPRVQQLPIRNLVFD